MRVHQKELNQIKENKFARSYLLLLIVYLILTSFFIIYENIKMRFFGYREWIDPISFPVLFGLFWIAFVIFNIIAFVILLKRKIPKVLILLSLSEILYVFYLYIISIFVFNLFEIDITPSDIHFLIFRLAQSSLAVYLMIRIEGKK